MTDEWLRAVRAQAEQTAALDRRQAITELERYAIDEAAMILRLLDEIERLRGVELWLTHVEPQWERLRAKLSRDVEAQLAAQEERP